MPSTAAARVWLPAVASSTKQLPVALIFACLIVVYVGIRYFWR